jgi:hypothetical protein
MRCELVDETLANIAGISNSCSVGPVDPDSGTERDTVGKNDVQKRKKEEISCFKELDVLSGELEASAEVWKSFMKAFKKYTASFFY